MIFEANIANATTTISFFIADSGSPVTTSASVNDIPHNAKIVIT
jgi:hypothetical protein